MKVVILGGSAHSTPALFVCLGGQPRLVPIDVTLAGRTPRHVAAVARASRLCAGDAPIAIHTCTMQAPDLRRALRDADVVLIQIRPGGLESRHLDETFPHKYGLCGDEGLGPGGLAAAWRAWPHLTLLGELLTDCCPGALVLLLTSPVSVLSRGMSHTFPQLRLYGICEVPWLALRGIADDLGVPPASLEFDYLGVNHIGWLHGLAVGNGAIAGDVPTKYVRMHDDAPAVLREQRSLVESRAHWLQRVGERNLTLFLDGDAAAVQAALSRRSAPWYGDAVGPLILACAGHDVDMPFFLSCLNAGWHPGFRPDDVLEIPHDVRDGRLRKRPVRTNASRDVQRTVQAFALYETLACDAVINRDPAGLADALRVHPWITAPAAIPRLVAEITDATAGLKHTA